MTALLLKAPLYRRAVAGVPVSPPGKMARKEGTIGVWLAMEKFNGTDAEVLENEPVWAAEVAT